MKNILLGLCLLMSVSSLPASEPLPGDVQRFIDRREGCDHMRGEMPTPGGKRWMRQMRQEIKKLCEGTDEELARLKKKYAMKKSVLRRLDEFEPGIEAARTDVLPGHAVPFQQLAPEILSPVRKLTPREQR